MLIASLLCCAVLSFLAALLCPVEAGWIAQVALASNGAACFLAGGLLLINNKRGREEQCALIRELQSKLADISDMLAAQPDRTMATARPTEIYSYKLSLAPAKPSDQMPNTSPSQGTTTVLVETKAKVGRCSRCNRFAKFEDLIIQSGKYVHPGCAT